MFRCLTAVARCAATAAVLVASTLPAAQAAHRDIGGWTVEDRPNGSTCSLYRSDGDRHFQLESNGEFHVVGPGIDGERSPAATLAALATEIEDGDAGLAPIAAAIGDARIVLLGEPWHGDGGAMRERARLVRHLHERHGFDVLAFESDFYAAHRGWAAVEAGEMPVAAFAAANLYAFWGAAPVMDDLWRYVASRSRSARPLAVAGIDTKVTGGLTVAGLPGDLALQLAPVTGQAEAARAADVLHRLLSPGAGATVGPEEFGFLEQAVSRLEEALRAGDARDGFWAQMAQSLRRQLSGENRDPGMAENLIWLATHRYPGRKIIVWAHNNHVMTDKWMLYDAAGPEVAAAVGDETPESIGRRTYLGEAVRFHFGDRAVYALGFLSGAGVYSADVAAALGGGDLDRGITAALAPAAAGTLEAALAARRHRLAFVDLRRDDARVGAVASRILDYSRTPPLPMDLGLGYDGVLYLGETFPLDGPAAAR